MSRSLHPPFVLRACPPDPCIIPLARMLRVSLFLFFCPRPISTVFLIYPPPLHSAPTPALAAHANIIVVTCPADVQAGMNLRIMPPAPMSTAQGTNLDRPPPPEDDDRNRHRGPMPQFMQMYEVVVPPGVRPNQSFSILANGQRVLVTCPPNVRPGMKVRFQLPSGAPASSAGGGGGEMRGSILLPSSSSTSLSRTDGPARYASRT